MLSSFISYIPKGTKRRGKSLGNAKGQRSGAGSARGWDTPPAHPYSSQVVIDIHDDRREPRAIVPKPEQSPKLDLDLPSERLDMAWVPQEYSREEPFTLMLEGPGADELKRVDVDLGRWGKGGISGSRSENGGDSERSSLNGSQLEVLRAYRQEGDAANSSRHVSTSSLRPNPSIKRRSRALSDNDVSIYSLEYVSFGPSAEHSPDSLRPRTPAGDDESTSLPYAMSTKKVAPAPITIPNASVYGPKVQISPGTTYGESRSRPVSIDPNAEPSSALSSGTSMARALFANSFVFSNQRHRSGVSISAARQDSATLPRGDNPFAHSPLPPDRKMSGDIISPAFSDADSLHRRALASASLRSGRRTSFAVLRDLHATAFDSPTLAGLDLSPGRRISRISEASSSAPSTPNSSKLLPNGTAPSESSEQPGGTEVQTSLKPTLVPAQSQDRSSPHSQAFKLASPPLSGSLNGTPLSPGEFSDPGSGQEIDNVLDYYHFDAQPNLSSKRHVPFSPISEESSSWLSPRSSRLPNSGRSEGTGSQANSCPSSPPQPGQRIDFASRRNPSSSPRIGPLAGPRQSLLPIGDRPRSIQVGPHTIVSPLTSGSSLGSSRLDTATTASSLTSPEDGVSILPPMRGLFNRQRSGSAPSPIKVLRDPRDLKAYNISVSPMSIQTATTPSTGGSDEGQLQQTFPETPSAFSPTWTPGIADTMSGERTHEYPVVMPLPGGRNTQPNLAQTLLTRAATTVRGATRGPAQRNDLPPPPSPTGRPHTLLLPSNSLSPDAKSTPLGDVEVIEEVAEPSMWNETDQPEDISPNDAVLALPPGIDPPSRVSSSHNSPISLREISLPRARSVSPAPSRHTPSPRPGDLASLAPSRRASSIRSFNSNHNTSIHQTDAASRSTPDLVPTAPRISPPVPVDVSPTDFFESPSIVPSTAAVVPSTPSNQPQPLPLHAMAMRSPDALFADAFPTSNRPNVSAPNSGSSIPSASYPRAPSFAVGELDTDMGHHLSASFVAPPPYHAVMFDPQQDNGYSPPVAPQSDYAWPAQTPSPANSSFNGAPESDSRTMPSNMSRRPRMRPPLPTGPRRPPQVAPVAGRDVARQRNASAPITNSSNPVAGRHQYNSSTPSFRTPPPQWRGYTLEAAKWTFTSAELQAIVSRAIRQSAEASSFRLLRLETLDNDIKNDMERLKVLRGDIKTRYILLTRKRASIFNSLAAYLAGIPPDQSTTLHLVDELADISSTLDALAEELDSVDEQMMQLASLCDIHSASALAMALRKLNTSFLKQVTENQSLRGQVEALEAERDEAWKQAQEVANDYDHLHERVDSAAPDSSVAGRSSRVMAVRKSSLRVSKAGLRSSSFHRSQRSSASSTGQRASVASPASASSPPTIVPPVPPIPKPRPLDIVTDLPSRSSTGIWSNAVTPTSESRALAKAQEELYDMLGISLQDSKTAMRGRSHSFAERRCDGAPPSVASGPEVQRHSNATTNSGRPSRRSSLPNNPSIMYDAMSTDRKAMLTTLGILSDH